MWPIAEKSFIHFFWQKLFFKQSFAVFLRITGYFLIIFPWFYQASTVRMKKGRKKQNQNYKISQDSEVKTRYSSLFGYKMKKCNIK